MRLISAITQVRITSHAWISTDFYEFLFQEILNRMWNPRRAPVHGAPCSAGSPMRMGSETSPIRDTWAPLTYLNKFLQFRCHLVNMRCSITCARQMRCETTAVHLHDPDFGFYCDWGYRLGFDVLNHGPYLSPALCRGNYHRDVLNARDDHGSDCGCDYDNALGSGHHPYWTCEQLHKQTIK